jgi:hypothetical protein
MSSFEAAKTLADAQLSIWFENAAQTALLSSI